jgi:hypothetical protein
MDKQHYRALARNPLSGKRFRFVTKWHGFENNQTEIKEAATDADPSKSGGRP